MHSRTGAHRGVENGSAPVENVLPPPPRPLPTLHNPIAHTNVLPPLLPPEKIPTVPRSSDAADEALLHLAKLDAKLGLHPSTTTAHQRQCATFDLLRKIVSQPEFDNDRFAIGTTGENTIGVRDLVLVPNSEQSAGAVCSSGLFGVRNNLGLTKSAEISLALEQPEFVLNLLQSLEVGVQERVLCGSLCGGGGPAPRSSTAVEDQQHEGRSSTAVEGRSSTAVEREGSSLGMTQAPDHAAFDALRGRKNLLRGGPRGNKEVVEEGRADSPKSPSPGQKFFRPSEVGSSEVVGVPAALLPTTDSSNAGETTAPATAPHAGENAVSTTQHQDEEILKTFFGGGTAHDGMPLRDPNELKALALLMKSENVHE